MNHIGNFIVGSVSCFGILGNINLDDLPIGGTIEELINYLVSVLGGILAALVITFLKKKFPNLWAKMMERSKNKKTD